MTEPIKVLFVGGSSRSGSTLLDRILGQIPGYVSTGEIRDVWRAGVGENRLCGCGREFAECPFWQRVGTEAFGGWSEVDRDDAQAVASSFGYRHAVRALWSPRADTARRHPRVVELLSRLYGGIAAAAEGATIIDSSKGPRYGVAVSSIPRVDFRAIHLVRDSRGVAYSWSKEVMRPDTPGRSVRMPRLGAAAVSARWIAHNTLIERLGSRVPVARLGYEALVRDPATELLRVLSELGWAVEPSALDFVRHGSVHLNPNHTVMGNPMRMASGEIPLRVDDAWRTRLPRFQRLQVTVMTWPMLIRYGYRP